MFKKPKPQTGYEKKKTKKQNKERQYLSNLVVPFAKKIPLLERILKFIIYISLRIVIKPSRWKQPEKNLEIIDRTYKKITSSDFVFIPSSIAFYLLMAFIPLVTIISLTMRISFLENEEFTNYFHTIFSDFIPGFEAIWNSLASINLSVGTLAGLITLIGSSLWISSAGFSRLIYTQSHLYGYKHVGWFWTNKIKGLLVVSLFSFALFLTLSTNLALVRLIRNSSMTKKEQEIMIKLLLYGGLIILVLIMYTALFKFSPHYKIKFRSIIPGAVVASIPTIIFIVVFGLIGKYLSYRRFGYIGTILYVGLLVLQISYFMIVGLIVNVSYYQTFNGKELKPKQRLKLFKFKIKNRE